MVSQTKRIIRVYLMLLVLLAVMSFLSLAVGSVRVSAADLLAVLEGKTENDMIRHILFDIRLPRMLAALILGGALSVSGFLLQTFFSNPIAGPFVLGISSGAKLVVSVFMILFLGQGLIMNSWGMVLAAFLGAMASMGFVLAISKKLPQMSMLVVSGIMIGYICSAATDFIVTFADDSNIVNLHNWSLGSFSGISWEQVQVMSGLVAAAVLLVFAMSKQIGAYQLGENYARSMGVNIRLFRAGLILLSSLLSACVTAFAGPISFVGIAVPHLVKGLFRSSRPLILIPGCFLGGALVCLLCDMIARTVFAPVELSISSVTALFGAPVVIWLMVDRRKGGR